MIATQINDSFVGWELTAVESMRDLARGITEATEALEAMVDEFNDRGGFAAIQADDGSSFKDVPDFLVRELGLAKEFIPFLVDDDE